LRFLSTEAPSLHRNYPASAVLRASPPSQSARPVSHELPVDPHCDHRWDFSCCVWSPLPTCRRQCPGRTDGKLVRSYDPINCGLPRNRGGSAPASTFSRPAQRSLTLRPACSPSRQSDLLHQRLQQLRCLRCHSDCYWVERASSQAGLTPAVDHHLFTTHPVSSFTRIELYAACSSIRNNGVLCAYFLERGMFFPAPWIRTQHINVVMLD
jgi:hypothetical protein